MTGVAAADAVDAESAFAAVLAAYIDAAREGRSALARGTFHPDATVRGRLHEADVDRSLAEFLSFIDTSGPAKNLRCSTPRIDLVGNAALARLECFDWHGVRCTDLFTLVRRKNRWLVASKVFHAHDHA